jgi:hypothetical protein
MPNKTTIQPNDDKLNKVAELQRKVDHVAVEMNENIKTALINNDKIHELGEKSESIKESSELFQKKAIQIKRSLYCKNFKMQIICFIIILIILGIIAGGIYGLVKSYMPH